MYKKPIALFMILLIVNIPFVMGDTYIKDLSATGSDGLDGYRKAYDQTVLEAFVKIDGDDSISPEQVKYGMLIFSQCAPAADDYFKCTYRSPMTSLKAGQFPLQITVFTDDGGEKSASTSIKIDGVGPVVTKLEFDTTAIGPDNFTITYTIKDYAGTGTSGCSGIKEISLFSGGSTVETITKTGDCSASGTLKYEGDKFASSSGPIKVCMQGIDMLGFEGDLYCKDMVADMDEPSPLSAILVEGDEKVDYLSLHTTSPDIIINISESHSGIDFVEADFSGVNSRYNNKISSSAFDQEGDIYLYKWTGIQIDPREDGKTIVVSGRDKAGNTFERSVNLEVIYDTTRPTPQLLTTLFHDEDEYYLRPDRNNLTLIMTESGSGFTEKLNVFLDLTEINGQNKVQANNCTTTTCEWWNIEVPGGIDGQKVWTRPHQDSTDDAGNEFADLTSFSLRVDMEKPKITNVQINSSSGFCPTHKDELILNISVLESLAYPPTILINTSEFSDAPMTFTCKNELVNRLRSNNFTCIATITELKDYAMVRNLIVEASDNAGNIGGYRILRAEICGLNTDPSESLGFVSVSAQDVIPSKLDKTLISSIPTLLFLKTSITTTGGASVLSKSISCYTEKDETINVDGSAFLLKEGTMNPLVGAYLAGENEESYVDLYCNVSTKIKVGDQVYKNPEINTIKKRIPLQGEALGKISDSIQDKLDDLDDDMEDIDEDIEKYENLNSFLSMLCSTSETLATMDAVLSVIITVLYWVFFASFNTARAIPVDGTAAEDGVATLWTTVCTFMSSVWHWIKKWIWPPGTGAANFPYSLTMMKYGCIIYSCRFCTGMDITGMTSTSGKVGGQWGFGTGSGKPNELGSVNIDGWDPYKSIHVSRSCFCLPGIIYNLKKAKQIKCIKKSCLRDNAKAGLPTTICEQAYKQNQCLYVDGAAWKIAGQKGLSQFISNFISFIMTSIPIFGAGAIWEFAMCPDVADPILYDSTIMKLICGEKAAPSPSAMSPLNNPGSAMIVGGCMIAGGALQVAEVGALNENAFDWDKYTADLEGEDYC